MYTKPKPQFKKGPNPEPERKEGKKGKVGKVMDLSAQELVMLSAKDGPSDVTLPPDGEFVRQLRTEDHFRARVLRVITERRELPDHAGPVSVSSSRPSAYERPLRLPVGQSPTDWAARRCAPRPTGPGACSVSVRG